MCSGVQYGVVPLAVERRLSDADLGDLGVCHLNAFRVALLVKLCSNPEACLGGGASNQVHDRVLAEFSDISDEELALPSMYWEGYEMSLRFRLHRFDSHLSQHIVQLDKTLPKIGYTPTEAKRLLRLIFAALAQAEGATIGAWTVDIEHWHETADKISERADEIMAVLA